MKWHRTRLTAVESQCGRQIDLTGVTRSFGMRAGLVGAILTMTLASLVLMSGCCGVFREGCCDPDAGSDRSQVSNATASGSRNVRPGGATATAGDGDVLFTVRAPKLVPVQRRVRETFPLRNYIFFDEGSQAVPARYERLTNDQATKFTEAQLQEIVPRNMDDRSERQMAVYYNILNILGDRMRSNPGSAVSLSGATGNGSAEGQVLAESVKSYLVNVFGIDGARITAEGREQPRVPSQHTGGTRELAFLRAEDRRVDIESRSPELLLQVGGPPDELRPVQIYAVQDDPLDGHVLFQVKGAREVLSSWSLELTDKHGNVQRFGPFVREQESIPGRTILANRTEGDFKAVMIGTTKSGGTLKRESSVYLISRDEVSPEGLRFSILFEFDKSKTIETYKSFLTQMVAPLVPEGGHVIIHGHTDVIGEEDYNHTLSYDRAEGARSVLNSALTESSTRGITFDAYGFGEDTGQAPFDNDLPEERFYNRTVIIDFVPGS